ncbi:MAG: hypothetical protein N2Z21_05570 [Candidatus Sumerlaeaceae bacterium]|nr:hypothetical protein [Candidatus Sumerlaeaceae bacterium]
MTSPISTIVRTGILVAGFAAIASMASAQAALPLYEPFSYPAGNLTGNSIAGGTWTQTGSNSSQQVQVSAGSLAYAGLPTPQGGKVTLLNGSGYEDPGLDITAQTAGTGYASFILEVVNAGNVAAGDYFFNFSSAGTGSTNYRTRVFVRPGSVAGQYNLGVGFSGAPTTWSGDLPVGTSVFLVAAYTFNASGDDVSSLWINPALGQASPPTADLTATATGADLTSLGRVNLRQGSTSTAQQFMLDELRVATSWAQVTPSASGVQDWSLY